MESRMQALEQMRNNLSFNLKETQNNDVINFLTFLTSSRAHPTSLRFSVLMFSTAISKTFDPLQTEGRDVICGWAIITMSAVPDQHKEHRNNQQQKQQQHWQHRNNRQQKQQHPVTATATTIHLASALSWCNSLHSDIFILMQSHSKAGFLSQSRVLFRGGRPHTICVTSSRQF